MNSRSRYFYDVLLPTEGTGARESGLAFSQVKNKNSLLLTALRRFFGVLSKEFPAQVSFELCVHGLKIKMTDKNFVPICVPSLY